MSGAVGRLLLHAGATAGLLQTYGVPVRWNQGPESRWWESFRQRTANVWDQIDSNAGPRPVVDAEFAGTLGRSLDETEQLLWELGFVRNPIARVKQRDGKPEDGSWVYRESPLSPRQLHLMLFERDEVVDIYAHEELSSVHPLCGPAHFRGEGQSVGAGVRRARTLLDLDTSGAIEEPPDCSWDETRR